MLPCYLYTFLVTFLLLNSPCIASRPIPEFSQTPPATTASNYYNINNYTWRNFNIFLNARRGSHVSGMSQLKRYFHHFGYLPLRDFDNITDTFDVPLESAVFRYQAKLGLPITGELDFNTVSQLMAPRCGVPDTGHKLHVSRNYVYFPGKPRWGRDIPMNLTYAFSPENLISYLKISDLQEVFKRAFSRWESVIPVSFIEISDYSYADIKIGFYNGDHGDGEPFDGILGVLAHSFSPESGKFHLDAAETWAVDFESEKSKVAVDLESVAVHEIGHLLGLAHSSVKEAVMYPSLKPRKKKVDLSVDDIQGVQALYGSNPNYTLGSLLESDISTNQAVRLRITSSPWATLTTTLLTLIYILLSFCM
ncbi:Metalloendoproteinase 1 precursor, putative [Ricinus communis]|uniref:Metalloendoproteinase 1, putative n=1 Tax=Ricinus communis TaxID=3988 RepID=B9RD50_RICCO|nr:Metalloendoproteinase 1 precursor, putative [Ricinus communis]|eukprot:XP_002511639.1 metalloendoproteinase 4-MMP [Ricinus communis]